MDKDENSGVDTQVGKIEPEPIVDTSKPDGRLKKFGDLCLLNDPEEAIYVPITQESTPMTEDMLEQHASVLVNLGEGDDAALLRAKIQSASLISDMESFKAANPGCILEDFVRWYSPRDFIVIEETLTDSNTGILKSIRKGVLSQRMTVPGNIWLDAWSQARSMPARKQKRLFDDTKEAENVFSWLSALSLGQIVDQMLPVLFYSAIFTSYCETVRLELDDYLAHTYEVLIDKIIKISRNNESKKYQDLVGYIKAIEQITSLMKSINSKFDTKLLANKSEEYEAKEFLKYLLQSISMNNNCEVKIPDGASGVIGKLIRETCRKHNASRKSKRSNQPEAEQFDDDRAGDCFDRPFKREYIMRSSVARPAPYSRQSPQRMYCMLSESEFRLAGAFTEDTMFF